MLVLAFLQRLPVAWVAAYGFLVVALHNLLDVFHASLLGPAAGYGCCCTSRGHILLHDKSLLIIDTLCFHGLASSLWGTSLDLWS